MAQNSSIEWTDHTFNPWWGCTRVSPGCVHCYAETFANRLGVKWGPQAERRLFGEAHWNEPLKWNRRAIAEGVRRRVFCASMADVFEDRPELAPERAKLRRLIEESPGLDWLLLTKRPENVERLWARAQVDAWDGSESFGASWPANVWLGVTAEDQQRADERIPILLATPAAVRFVSYEPAIGPVDFEPWLDPTGIECIDVCPGRRFVRPVDVETIHDGKELLPICPDCGLVATWTGYDQGLDWIIVGGESGPGARPFDLAWARSVVAQCKAAGVAVFYKQGGASNACTHDRKGGHFDCFPPDLQIREFPR